MVQILLSSTISHWGHVSLGIPHCVHARDAPLLHHPPLGTCVTGHPPLRTCQRSSSPPPSPTGDMCHSASPTAYMVQILLSSTISHWGHVSVSVPHCVHGTDPPLLHHLPLGTCVTDRPALRTYQRSSCPPPSPTGDMCHWASPTAYMPEILLSSTIPHWGHVSVSVPHCIHGTDPPLLHHLPLGTCVTQHPPLRTWYRSSSPPPSPTEDMCHWASPTAYMPEILLSSTIPHWEHVSVSVPHCVHGTDPPLLSHPPLVTCVTEHPPLCTWLRSSSLPPSPTRDMCQ